MHPTLQRVSAYGKAAIVSQTPAGASGASTASELRGSLGHTTAPSMGT